MNRFKLGKRGATDDVVETIFAVIVAILLLSFIFVFVNVRSDTQGSQIVASTEQQVAFDLLYLFLDTTVELKELNINLSVADVLYQKERWKNNKEVSAFYAKVAQDEARKFERLGFNAMGRRVQISGKSFGAETRVAETERQTRVQIQRTNEETITLTLSRRLG